jgi:uncharacterized repeat protein (TIGR04138 family)
MTAPDDELDLQAALEKNAPYPMEAFAFVREGLDHTVRRLHGDMPEGPIDEEEIHDRHVDGSELSLGLLHFSIRKYGLMAETVLAHWNITRTDDFGRIVFAMIEQGLMSKTDQDDLEDFFGVRPFSTAFSPGTVKEALIEIRLEERSADRSGG